MTRAALALATLAIVSGIALVATPALGASPLGPGPAGASPLLNSITAPVYISFPTSAFIGHPGGHVVVSGNVTNKGTLKFVASSCDFWYRTGGGAWTKGSNCFKGYFPLTFDPGTVFTVHVAQKVSSTFPTGIYQWKIVLFGKYGKSAEQSHDGLLTVDIT
jgi:hypothetical protein